MYNCLNMFGIGNIFSGVCNTYTNYYGYGSGMGCCNSVFNYKGLMGLAIGSTIAPILGMITYKGISNAVANKQANSVDNYDARIREQLNILGITTGVEKDGLAVTIDDSEEAKALKAAKNEYESLNTELTTVNTELTEAKNNYENYLKDPDNQKLTEYNNVCEQLKDLYNQKQKKYDDLKAKVDEAARKQNEAKIKYDDRETEIKEAKDKLVSLINERNEKLFDDADGSSLFRTSKDKLDTKLNGDYSKATKQDIKAALYEYTKATDPEQKEKYKKAFIDMYNAHDRRKVKVPLGSDIEAAYKLLSK